MINATALSDNEKAIIIVDSINGFEYKNKSLVLQQCKNESDLFDKNNSVWNRLKNVIDESKINSIKLCFEKDYYDQIFDELDKKHITAICSISKDYPEQLKNSSTPPLVLYCKGNLHLLKEKTFAIVGSRKTLPYALKFAESVSREISSLGCVVVTGSAIGGDRSAILGAIESGNVISVLAHGHDMVYPESNRDLIEKVEKRGLVVSEYPPKFSARSWCFPVRNRIIAGLSKGVLIVSGEKTSGARHTANYAIDFGRDVYAIPYSIGIKSGELCNELIKNGAILCDSCEDIKNDLQLENKQTANENDSLDDIEKIVLEQIREGVEDAYSLLKACDLKIYELAPIVSSLEIKGLIVKLLGNKFKATK